MAHRQADTLAAMKYRERLAQRDREQDWTRGSVTWAK
jgi:hypothetical protein